MDNDNKITTGKPEIRLFLQDTLMPAKSDIFSGYDFEREFEKTQKNKNLPIRILLAATIAVSLLITAGISAYQTKKNTEITVNINAFQDLNLKKLLASFQRAQTDLENTIAEKESMKKAFQSAMEEAGFTRDSAIIVLDSMGLEETERSERAKVIEADYSKTAASLKSDYERQISEIDQRISSLQEQLATLKTPELAQAQKDQGAIDSQQQVFALEKQKLVSAYEKQLEEQRAKFSEFQKQSFENQKQAVEAVSKKFLAQIDQLDPVISDEKGNNLAAGALEKEPTPVNLEAAAANKLLQPEESQALQAMQSDLAAADYLAAFLLEILPQKNSVPEYVGALKNSIAAAGNSANTFFSASITEREAAQKEIASLNASREKALGETKKQLETAQNQFAAASKNLADITAKYNELNAKNTELTKNFTAANTSVTTLTRQNSTLSTQVTAAEAKAADLNAKMTAAQNQLVEAQKTLTDTQTKLKAAEAEAALKAQMENYLTYLINQSGDAGFIVDVGDRKSFLIQVHPDQTARIENRTVYIFSKETSELLGPAIIRKKGNNLYAYPTSDTLGPKVSVSDRISLTNTLKTP